MNATKTITLAAMLWAAGLLCAQTPADPRIEPVAPPSAVPDSPELPTTDTVAEPGALAENIPNPPPAAEIPEAPPAPPADPAVPSTPGTQPAATPFGPLENQKQEMQKSEEGFIIKDAALNDIFQFLAKTAGRQYFHNTKIAGPDFLVTGHLNDGNPLSQMEELAFMYGLSLHTKGNTIYALTAAQLAQLPSMEFHYQLRYLRPTDMEQIKELIKPMLSPGTGIVNFEPKTSTIIIIDSAHRIEQARELLHGIDKAKGQIIVETKILRVLDGGTERSGINWSSSLGKTGTSVDVAANLNSIFGLPPVLGGDSAISSTDLVLSPVQLTGVLRALNEGNLARQLSNPTLITEDNEQATISLIDRVPIITSTQSGTGNTAIKTEEVRYKIGMEDKTIDMDPEKHREIGISLVVTPTLLPDGTLRMKMRPRSAQIVEEITSIAGNKYPRVAESMVETIARIPDGHSLIVGGFYGETQSRAGTKVPLLGDVPLLNFFFKSKDSIKEKSSLVFIVTPKSYNPANIGSNTGARNRMHANSIIDCDADWANPDNPGPGHEPNVRRTIRGMQPAQAPYYPRIGEEVDHQAPAPAPASRSKSSFGKGSRL